MFIDSDYLFAPIGEIGTNGRPPFYGLKASGNG
jgi:hypothetical protein